MSDVNAIAAGDAARTDPDASGQDRRSPWTQTPFLLAAGLLAMKLGYLAFPNLFPEEAYYWLYARHLDFGYLDHPPMVAWLIALGTLLFGDTEFGIRFPAFVCSLVTSWFVFKLTALLYNRRAAALAVLVVQVLPYYFLTGFVMTPDAPLSACWAAMLYWLACALFERRASAWWGVGVCLGVGMLSKYTIALLGPATLLFLALDPASRFWFRRSAPYWGVALAIVIFSPVVAWNALHQWASFAFQTTGRTRKHRTFALHELLGAIVAVLTPVGVWLAANALRRDESGRRRLFARVFTLVPLSVFVLFSLTHHVKLNWTGPLWLAAIPAVAAGLFALGENAAANRTGRATLYAWRATVAVCTLGYVLILQHLAFGLPGVKYSRNIELLPVGWPDLTREVERQKANLIRDGASPVYVVGMDRNFLASELSFYQSERRKALSETTGAHLFESISLMYGHWFPPARFEGGTLLLVGFNKHDLTSNHVPEHCDTVGPVQTQMLSHHGKPVRPYYTRVVSGYHVTERPPRQ